LPPYWFETKYLDIEIPDHRSVEIKYLDVKRIGDQNMTVSKTTDSDQLDSVDRYLASWGEQLPEIDLEVEGIVDRIMALSRRLQRMMENTLSEFGLTFGEWSVLAHLRRIGPPHTRSPGELARHGGLSSGAMTNRLDRLEEAGFVRRHPDPDDRRSIQVELTEDGHRVVGETIGAQAAKESVVAAALGERERQELNTFLRRLMLALDDAGLEPKKHAEETPG
jgi:DNA-binding MarR family transcriptional regulator